LLQKDDLLHGRRIAILKNNRRLPAGGRLFLAFLMLYNNKHKCIKIKHMTCTLLNLYNESVNCKNAGYYMSGAGFEP
jgi:hypothetical protein